MTPFTWGLLIGTVGGLVLGFCVAYVLVRVPRRERMGYLTHTHYDPDLRIDEFGHVRRNPKPGGIRPGGVH